MDSHKAAKAVKPKRNMSLGLVSLLFLAPALVFYIAFELWPIIQTIWYSFYEWNGIDASTFIGVENYITVFTDPDERARLGALMASLTPAMVVDDATAFADFLEGRPEVAAGPIGTTGYCMGGRISLESKPGQGTELTLTLPAERAAYGA